MKRILYSCSCFIKILDTRKTQFIFYSLLLWIECRKILAVNSVLGICKSGDLGCLLFFSISKIDHLNEYFSPCHYVRHIGVYRSYRARCLSSVYQ